MIFAKATVNRATNGTAKKNGRFFFNAKTTDTTVMMESMIGMSKEFSPPYCKR